MRDTHNAVLPIAIIAALLSMAVIPSAQAAASANYRNQTSVVASGGGAAVSVSYGAPVNVIGQGAVGTATSASHKNYVGFVPTLTDTADLIERVRRYLLGLDTNPTGLDTNNDGAVDMADMIFLIGLP